MAGPFIFFGTMFFLAGGAFAYYVAFPFAVQFLLQVGEDFKAVITVERYFGFLMTVILGLGVMFELPVLIVLLSMIGVVTPGFLVRKFRWAVLIIAMLSAILTPTPDIFNMCLFAVPTLGLYLLGIGGAFVVERLRRRRVVDVADAADAADARPLIRRRATGSRAPGAGPVPRRSVRPSRAEAGSPVDDRR